MRRVVRPTILASLALAIAIPAAGFTARQLRPSRTGPTSSSSSTALSTTPRGERQRPGYKGSVKDDTGTRYVKGRGGMWVVKRVANGLIAPKTANLNIPANTTRTVVVCNSKLVIALSSGAVRRQLQRGVDFVALSVLRHC